MEPLENGQVAATTGPSEPESGETPTSAGSPESANDQPPQNDCGQQPAGLACLGLDPSGKTIPDANYPIPAGAVFMATNGDDASNGTQSAPVKTLNRAMSLVQPNGTIVVRGGVYRVNGSAQKIVNWNESNTGGDVYYSSLAPFTDARGWESHGLDITGGGDLLFVNGASGDFRVGSESPAYGSGMPLPADVASVLDLQPGAVITRGAVAWPAPPG